MPHAAARPARLLVVAALCCAAGAAEPPRQGPEARAVRVCVVAILATDKNDKIDPRLTDVAREVQVNVDPRLTGFSVACAKGQSLKPGDCHTFQLGCDQAMTVT